MKYILDTDTLIYFLKGHSTVVNRIAPLSTNELATTIINHAELLFGAFNSTKVSHNLEKISAFLNQLTIIHFCKESSFIFAEYKAALKKKGTIVADLDLMIASIVLKHQSVLITNNTRHFSRIKKLNLENWSV